jgi:hypothetical protein
MIGTFFKLINYSHFVSLSIYLIASRKVDCDISKQLAVHSARRGRPFCRLKPSTRGVGDIINDVTHN